MHFAAIHMDTSVQTALITERALEAAGIVLFSPAMKYVTGETTFILQEISNIHRLAYHISAVSAQLQSFLGYLSKVVTADFYAEYVQLLKITEQYQVGDPDCVSQVNGQLNLLKNMLIRMLEVTPR